MEKNMFKIALIIMIVLVNLIILTMATISVVKSAKDVINNKDTQIISDENEINDDYSNDEVSNTEKEIDSSETKIEITEIIKNINLAAEDIIKLVLVLIGFNLLIISIVIFIKIKK